MMIITTMTAKRKKKPQAMIGTDSTIALIGDFSFCYSIVYGRPTEASGAEVGAIHLKPLRVRFPAANDIKFFDLLVMRPLATPSP